MNINQFQKIFEQILLQILALQNASVLQNVCLVASLIFTLLATIIAVGNARRWFSKILIALLGLVMLPANILIFLPVVEVGQITNVEILKWIVLLSVTGLAFGATLIWRESLKYHGRY